MTEIIKFIRKRTSIMLGLWALSLHMTFLIFRIEGSVSEDWWYIPWVFGTLPQTIHLFYLMWVAWKLKRKLKREIHDLTHPKKIKKYTLKELIEKNNNI
jgi:hypothetical protein